MGFCKKIYNFLYKYFVGFMFGLKNTETEIFTSAGGSSTIGTHISQEVNDQRVSKALLKGEVTQQVKELRYRTYKVDREAKQYEYFSPTLAKKRDKNDSKFVSYENSENLKVITIQHNEQKTETIEEALERVDENELEYTNPLKEYNICINRTCVTRYRIEEFLKRLVVKQSTENNKVVLDFYVSKYQDDKNLFSKGFLKEIDNIINGKINNDMIDIQSVYFVTNHAFQLNDMLEFEFNNLKFIKIVEYDGNYILKFKANMVKNGNDLTDKYYCKEMAENYKEKKKKDIVLNLADFGKVYTCEMCGKQIVYNEHVINSVIPTSGDDIIDEQMGKQKTNSTEYMDVQITEQTYGKVLCNDCLKKYLSDINELK